MSQIDLQNFAQSPAYQQELAAQRTYMARVYSWMTLGLLTTAFTALVVVSQPAILHMLFDTGLIWLLIVGQLAIGLGIGYAYRSMPVPVVSVLFIVYSVLIGAWLAPVLLIYTLGSVAATFFITAGMFAGMSIWGYVTHRDLTSMGSFLMMGFFGLVIAIIVNCFLQSDAMDWLISFVGVIVFTGLTAYHTQKISQSYAVNAEGSAMYRKSALVGAMALYVDFINLFIMLLRFVGNRRN